MTSDRAIREREFLATGAGQAATMLRLLGNERRLRVLCLLIDRGEMTVGAIADEVALSQSALSQHLARMREEGLVDSRREAQSVFYRIAEPKVRAIVSVLKRIYCE